MILSLSDAALANDRLTPQEVVQKVRQAIGFDAWHRQTGRVLFQGTSDYLGMAGTLQVLQSPNGEFRQTIEAHGEHALGSNGKVLWQRAFSQKPRLLDLGEAETEQAFLAVRTHGWLADNSPFQVSVETGATKGNQIVLKLSRPTCVLSTQVVLDRRTWLPIKASRPWLLGEMTWEFSDYEEFQGTRWPRKLLFRHGSAVDRFDVTAVRLAPSAHTSPFAVPEVPASLTWDRKLPARVEIKRTPSGHFFVKGMVNGQDVGWFALDTGTGSGQTISRKIAERLGQASFGSSFFGGAGQENRTQFRAAVSFQVGPARVATPVFYELPEAFTDSMASLFGFEWAGTIGHDFLSQVVAELDLAACSLDLRDPAGYELNAGTWQRLRFNHGIPCLRCQVEGHLEGWFQLDTGAGAVAIIHAPAVEAHQLLQGRTTRPYPLPGVGGAIDAQMGKLQSFLVARREMRDVLTFFVTGKHGALTDPYTLGTFGAGLLQRDKLILDYGNRRAALIRRE
jgi:predicted aspartyl protease